MSAQNNTESQSFNPIDVLSLQGTISAVLKRKLLFFVIVLLAIAAGITYSFLVTPLFKATAKLEPVTGKQSSGLSSLAGQFGGLASMAGIDIPSGEGVQTTMATMESRTFLIEYMKRHGIDKAIVDSLKKESDSSEQITVSEGKLYKRFMECLTLNLDKKTGILYVSIEWIDPKEAASWCNLLVKDVNEHLRAEAQQEAKQSLDFLREKLEETRLNEIKASIYSLIENETNKAMLANVRESYALKFIDQAFPPEERSYPVRRSIAIKSLFLGVFFAMLFTILLEIRSLSRMA